MAEIEKNAENSTTENSNDAPSLLSESRKKQKKPGVVHLTYVPRYMTVKKVREHFSEFGEVTRLFLKPEKSKKQGKPSKFFSEGWVEFASRKIARQVADCLNGTQVGGKRHTPYFDALWSIKYLKGFHWGDLNEAKVYEKSRKEQKMRAEIAKVKKEIDSYTRSVDKMKRLKKKTDIQFYEKDLKTSNSDISKTSETEADLFKTEITPERQSSLLRKVFGNIV